MSSRENAKPVLLQKNAEVGVELSVFRTQVISLMPAPTVSMRGGDSLKIKSPVSVFLELTASCNVDCIHCYISCKKRENELSTEEILKFIDQCIRDDVPSIIFTGGEPFCRKDILKILNYSIDCEIWTDIFTNGTLLGGKLLEKVCEMDLNNIQMTLFSHVPEVHDRLVQMPGAFEKTVKAIKAFVDAGHVVNTNTPVLEENVSHIPRLFELASSLGVDGFGIFPALAYGEGENSVEKSKISDLYVKAGSYLYHAKKELKEKRMHLDGVIGRVIAQLGGPPKNIFDIFFASNCAAAKGMITITSHGDVIPCTIFSECSSEVRGGNIRENSLIDIWNNSPFFERLRYNEQNNTICRNCKMREECPRCIAEVYCAYGTFDAPDPRCPKAKLYEKEYSDVVP